MKKELYKLIIFIPMVILLVSCNKQNIAKEKNVSELNMTPKNYLVAHNLIEPQGNNFKGDFYAERIAGVKTISFVDAISYIPGGDDDFEFEITPGVKGKYNLRSFGGNSTSRLSFRLSTWELPDNVTVNRDSLELTGTQVKEKTFNKLSVVIVELLAYLPDGDDDLAYLVTKRTEGLKNIYTFRSHRANRGLVKFRVTALSWNNARENVDEVDVTIGNNRLEEVGYTDNFDQRLLALPLIYETNDDDDFYFKTEVQHKTETNKLIVKGSTGEGSGGSQFRIGVIAVRFDGGSSPTRR